MLYYSYFYQVLLSENYAAAKNLLKSPYIKDEKSF